MDNLQAFDDALMEVDSSTYMLLATWIDRLALHFQQCGNIELLETARSQAKAVIAAIVMKEKYDRLILSLFE